MTCSRRDYNDHDRYGVYIFLLSSSHTLVFVSLVLVSDGSPDTIWIVCTFPMRPRVRGCYQHGENQCCVSEYLGVRSMQVENKCDERARHLYGFGTSTNLSPGDGFVRPRARVGTIKFLTSVLGKHY
jgi:hypothetical protein